MLISELIKVPQLDIVAVEGVGEFNCITFLEEFEKIRVSVEKGFAVHDHKNSIAVAECHQQCYQEKNLHIFNIIAITCQSNQF